jgi:hypothetical protein
MWTPLHVPSDEVPLNSRAFFELETINVGLLIGTKFNDRERDIAREACAYRTVDQSGQPR